jgi:hypothetical protein
VTYEYASLHTRWYTCALEYDIHLAHTVDVSNCLRGVLSNCQVLIDICSPLHRHKVAGMSETILSRKVQPPLIDIGNNNLLRTLHLRNSRTQQSHSASTKHNHSSIFRHQASPESMQRNTKRLEQSSNIQADIFRQFVAPFCRVVDLLLQRSLEMWEALATAPEPQLFANVVSSL